MSAIEQTNAGAALGAPVYELNRVRKSTLLKVMAGLIAPIKGRVVLQGEPVIGPHRDFGTMFQQATLSLWKMAMENIFLPIEIRGGNLFSLVGALNLFGGSAAFKRSLGKF